MSQHNTEEDLPRKQQQPQECKTCPVLYGRVRQGDHPARAVEQHKTPRFPRRFRNRRVDSFHPFHCHLGPTLAPTHPSVKVTRGESSRGGVPLPPPAGNRRDAKDSGSLGVRVRALTSVWSDGRCRSEEP
jgi:hypothetical protein